MLTYITLFSEIKITAAESGKSKYPLSLIEELSSNDKVSSQGQSES